MLSSIRQELWSPSEEQSEKSSSAGPCILKNSCFSTKKLVVGFFLKESYAQEVHTKINNKFSDHEDLLSLEVNTDFSICLSQYLTTQVNQSWCSLQQKALPAYICLALFHLHYIKLWVCHSPRMQSLGDKSEKGTKSIQSFNHSLSYIKSCFLIAWESQTDLNAQI